MSDLNLDVQDLPNDENKEVLETPQYSEDEKLAISRGWKPKEEWDGPEDEWKPAKVFNEIGELKEQIQNKDKDLKKAHKVMSIMKDHHLKVRQSAYQEALKDLKAERERALEEQDFVAAEKIKDKIDDIRTNFQTNDVLPAEIEKELQQVNAASAANTEALTGFMARNPWYKPNSTDQMSKKADALGWAYRNEDPNMAFDDILKNVETDLRKLFPEYFSTPRNPVNEPGSRSAPSKQTEKVKLSAEEIEVARTFGMSPEEYAKELKSYRGR